MTELNLISVLLIFLCGVLLNPEQPKVLVLIFPSEDTVSAFALGAVVVESA